MKMGACGSTVGAIWGDVAFGVLVGAIVLGVLDGRIGIVAISAALSLAKLSSEDGSNVVAVQAVKMRANVRKSRSDKRI